MKKIYVLIFLGMVSCNHNLQIDKKINTPITANKAKPIFVEEDSYDDTESTELHYALFKLRYRPLESFI